MRNTSTLDRIIRLFISLALFQLAYFWLAGGWQILVFVVGIIALATAALGVCPLYRLIGIRTDRADARALGRIGILASALLVIVLLVAGSYASDFFTRKRFVEDFNAMNTSYKQTLFSTGQNDRAQAVANYDQLVVAYGDFQAKYTSYHPYAIKGDGQFDGDLGDVAQTIADTNTNIHTGDLALAHTQLETIRPVFQDIFKRNDFLMLSITLVDFHDAMELILDPANAKDPQQVIAIYPQVSEKLHAVEVEANDAEIQAIRTNLDALLSLAQRGAVDGLPAKAGELKSSFVRVYLVRG
jgi:hypothetical protein